MTADDVRVRRAEAEAEIGRATPKPAMAPNPGVANGGWQNGSRPQEQGLDIRYVVTNLQGGSAEWLYDTLYRARGQAEN